MLNDLRQEILILLFRVLLIENAVLLVPESDAAEAVFAGMAMIGVERFVACPRRVGEEVPECPVAAVHHFVAELQTLDARFRDVSAVLRIEDAVAVTYILAALEVVGIM